MNKIAKNVVVSLAYQLRTEDGVLIEDAQKTAPLEYLHGYDELVIGLENALAGRQVGDRFEITIGPDEAYGHFDDALVQRVPKSVFSSGDEELSVGMRFLADTDEGEIPVEITAIEGDEVVVDGNHMLAGQTLHFTVEVLNLRAATEEEIAHGHVHNEHTHLDGSERGGNDHIH